MVPGSRNEVQNFAGKIRSEAEKVEKPWS